METVCLECSFDTCHITPCVSQPARYCKRTPSLVTGYYYVSMILGRKPILRGKVLQILPNAVVEVAAANNIVQLEVVAKQVVD